MPTCPSCHRDQIQSSAFCAYCGAVLDRPASTPPSPPIEPPPQAVSYSAQPSPPTATTTPGSTRAKLGSSVHHETGDVGAYVVRRLSALIVDLIVVGGLITIAAHSWVTNASAGGVLTAGGFVQLLGVAAVALFVYRWLFEGLLGTTLGKLIFGLGVGSVGGGSAGLGRTFVRNLVLPVDLALIGFLLAAVTPQRRRVGDFIAGTVVANSRIGALAPLIGVLVLGASTYAVFAYAGGVSAAQHLERDATRLAPSLVPAVSPAPQPSAASSPPAPSPSSAATTGASTS